MSGVRIPPPRPSPSGYATEKESSLRVSAAGSLFALLDGGCSSPGRAPDCGSGGSGFETRQPPHLFIGSDLLFSWALFFGGALEVSVGIEPCLMALHAPVTGLWVLWGEVQKREKKKGQSMPLYGVSQAWVLWPFVAT